MSKRALLNRPAALPGARPGSAAPWRWALAGLLLGWLASLVVFAPAAWATTWVQHLSGARVLLEDARGTLWQGSARLSLSGGPGSLERAQLPGRLHWQLQAGRSGLGLQLRADCCLAQHWRWQLRPRWGGVSLALSDQPSHWPAHLLQGLGTPWNTLQLQGQLALRTEGAQVDWVGGRLRWHGRAELDALDLSSRLSTLQPLGSYRLTLSAGQSGPELLLSTLTGSLQLSGQGQWVGQRLRFRGQASASAQTQDALGNLLNLIGRRNGALSIINLG